MSDTDRNVLLGLTLLFGAAILIWFLYAVLSASPEHRLAAMANLIGAGLGAFGAYFGVRLSIAEGRNKESARIAKLRGAATLPFASSLWTLMPDSFERSLDAAESGDFGKAQSILSFSLQTGRIPSLHDEFTREVKMELPGLFHAIESTRFFLRRLSDRVNDNSAEKTAAVYPTMAPDQPLLARRKEFFSEISLSAIAIGWLLRECPSSDKQLAAIERYSKITDRAARLESMMQQATGSNELGDDVRGETSAPRQA